MENSQLLKEAQISTGWNNHLPLVYLALLQTDGDIVEMGVGDGSTRQLTDFAIKNNRKLISYETIAEWANRFYDTLNENHEINLITIAEWGTVYENNKNASVVLIDHNPGEDRKFRADQFSQSNAIVICHDAQPQPNAGDYQFETIFHKFKYRIRLQPDFNHETNDYPTGAIAMSNSFDVTSWEGLKFGEWTVSNSFKTK